MSASRKSERCLEWSTVVGEVVDPTAPMKKESPVLGSTVSLVGGRVYIIGRTGRHSEKNATSVYYLDIPSNSWHFVPSLGPYLMHHVSMLVTDKIYIFGGLDKNRLNGRDLWAFDFATKEFLKCPTSAVKPQLRHNCIGEYVESVNMIVIFGGYYDNDRNRGNDLWRLSMDSMTWCETIAKGEAPSARSNHASCSDSNTVYIFGGYKRVERLNDLHILSFTPSSITWSQPVTSGFTPGGRSSHSLSFVSGKLILFGGSNGAGMNEVAVLDLRSMRWHCANRSDNQGGQYVLKGGEHPGVYHAATVGPCGNLFVFGGRHWSIRSYRKLRLDEV